VAITRARRELVLISPAAAPRRGSAWATLSGDEAALAPTFGAFEDAATLLGARLEPGRQSPPGLLEPASAAPASLVVAPPERPAASPSRELAVATTPLGTFDGCARRFRLRHLVGLDEPVATGQLDLFGGAPPDEPEVELERDDADPRELGRAAHRVLERWPAERWGDAVQARDVAARLEAEGLPARGAETARVADAVARFLSGPYVRALRDAGATLLREREVVLRVPFAGVPATEGRSLLVRGAIDLVAARDDGTVDVVDYKLSRPRADLSAYAFQLRTYALWVARARPSARVRAGIVFLGGGAATAPVFLSSGSTGDFIGPDDHARFERELAGLGARFAVARWSDRYDAVPLDRCRTLRCGFVAACHGRARDE
jgi:ATP-dependent helicase/nuclease subunit A